MSKNTREHYVVKCDRDNKNKEATKRVTKIISEINISETKQDYKKGKKSSKFQIVSITKIKVK